MATSVSQKLIPDASIRFADRLQRLRRAGNSDAPVAEGRRSISIGNSLWPVTENVGVLLLVQIAFWLGVLAGFFLPKVR